MKKSRKSKNHFLDIIVDAGRRCFFFNYFLLNVVTSIQKMASGKYFETRFKVLYLATRFSNILEK